MKKGLLILVTVSIIAAFTACGSSEESTPEEATSEETEAEEDDTEYVTGTYKGMTFELPGDWLYQEDENTMAFYSSDSEAMIMLQSVDLSVSDDEYNDEALDILFEASFDSIKAQYTEFQEGSIDDRTVAGCQAQEMKASVTLSDTEMSDDILVVYDEEGRYFYLIQYLVKNEVEENTKSYEHFLDSISFDAAVADETQTDENNAAEGTSESSSRSTDVVQSEDGYDITYQKYDLYENSLGEIRMYGIVEIKNTGDTNLQLRSSTFTLTDNDGNLIGVDSYTSADPSIIRPGEYGYIYSNEHSIDGEISVDGDYVFVPELTVKETDKDPVVYEVSDTSISEGKYDKADVMGRVTNNTDEDKTSLYVVIVLYDKDDKPLGIFGTTVHDFTAGETMSFDADAISLDHADFTYSDVARYEVIAQK